MTKNTTKRVSADTLEGKDPLAVGYKIFEHDWGAQGGYHYADRDGDAAGSVHTVTGALKKCNWGLHFCKNPLDCMKYQKLLPWNRFAKVEAYDEILDGGDKTVARTLKIVEELSFGDMIAEIKAYRRTAVSGSTGVSRSYGVSASNGVSDSNGVSGSNGVRGSNGVNHSDGVNRSYGVSDSAGVRGSNGVFNVRFCKNVRGVADCIFCVNLRGESLMLFNRQVTGERFSEVLKKIGAWYPQFTNAEELREKYGHGEWSATPAHIINGRDDKAAYAAMPEDLIAYVKSLPEYDAEIFTEITGLEG